MYVGQPCNLHTTVPHRSERAGPEQCSGPSEHLPKPGTYNYSTVLCAVHPARIAPCTPIAPRFSGHRAEKKRDFAGRISVGLGVVISSSADHLCATIQAKLQRWAKASEAPEYYQLKNQCRKNRPASKRNSTDFATCQSTAPVRVKLRLGDRTNVVTSASVPTAAACTNQR